MAESLRDRTVVVIGRSSGIARAIADSAVSAGARVVVAGRNPEALADAYEGKLRAERVDVTDDASIASLAATLGPVDHLVSTASARARGVLGDLERADVLNSLNTKVLGPLMLAKHFAPQIAEDGSFTLFSGVAAFKPAVGYLGVAITNGAADFLTRCLALELAPIRVNAIAPGVIDTGAWDAMGEEGKQAYFDHFRTHNPARRIGTSQDVADAVLFAMTNPFLTGVTLRVDGGEPLT
ncbi:short-chain dehydrogenase/reductase SDR [Catenulispora acidiphila DSM 44928]|uniref:Short-chain dehydrogenase/reductase SDR n=1 Tax=Catenulispora acidiphila (strain DSM 44928 / JCM 14897 / NBRC 102108 / NRRL B-24433 / ID139908) TaxID=479433 RepID=C7Q4E5_CATAD|nr:SDR family oxidoreductase [Catenulispora acidiphila]ACU70005.1 short-chain dehydrogenase/reductase SDR [Catenulispora acidiphila DSM 44928]